MNFKVFTSFGLGLVLATALVTLDSHITEARCKRVMDCSLVNGIKKCKIKTICSKDGLTKAPGFLPPDRVARLERLVELGQATAYQRRQLANHYRAVRQLRSNQTQSIN